MPDNPLITTIRTEIYGRVQGVGYRHWTVGMAQQYGLVGWVRNRQDGSVEALFQGSLENIEQMLKACEDGPSFAKVSEIKTEAGQHEDLKNFTWKETVS